MTFNHLSSISLKSFISTTKQNVIVAKSTDSLMDTITLLTNNHILSCPVYNEQDECIGLIDVLDILYFVMDIGDRALMSKNTLMQSALQIEYVGNVLDVSKRNPFVPMTEDDSAMKLLKQFSNGVHRVCIVDNETRKVKFVFSQSTAFNYFCNLENGILLNEEWFQKLLDQKVESLQIGTRAANKKIITVQDSVKAFDAFTVMRKNALSAIAIVSKNDKIVGNISASDVRGFLNSSYHVLGENVMDFLMQTKKQENGYVPNLVFCKPEHTFRVVLKRLSEQSVHRIYIVRGDDVTIEGVITMGDILSFLYSSIESKE